MTTLKTKKNKEEWWKRNAHLYKYLTGWRLKANYKLLCDDGFEREFTPKVFFYHKGHGNHPFSTPGVTFKVHLPTSLCRRAKNTVLKSQLL